MITRDDIAAICPPPASPAKRAIWNGYVEAILSREGERLLDRYQLTTPDRMIGFLACVCKPEGGLALIWESGAYSPERLVEVFGPHRHSARITLAEARKLCAKTNPISLGHGIVAPGRDYAIFERVYGLGNPSMAKRLGNTHPGDGYLFRGLGMNQMTGREAHERAAAKIGCSLEDLAKPLNCLHMALLEWSEKNCNAYADKQDWVSIRKLVNAGTTRIATSAINGLPSALAAVKVAKKVITASDFNGPAAATSVASADHLPGPDDDDTHLPTSMAQSTESHAAMATGGGGSLALYQGAQNGVMKAASTGDLSAGSLFMAMLSEPLVWAGVTIVFTAVYWWFKRRHRLIFDGV